MDTTLIEIAKTIPVAAAIIYVVIVFLRSSEKKESIFITSSEKRDSNFIESLEKRDMRFIESIHKMEESMKLLQLDWTRSLIDVTLKSNATIDKCTDALINVASVIGQCQHIIKPSEK